VNILHAPAGKIIRGHVMDVSLKPFERALKDHDKSLYVRWNPKKLKGHGCWEIRRHPTKKTAVYQGTHNGAAFYKLMSVEYNDIHHIMDCAFLNYDQIRKIKEMDVFDQMRGAGIDPNSEGAFDLYITQQEEAHAQKQSEKAAETLRYAISHNKSAMRELTEMVKSGISLDHIITSTDWSQKP